MVSNKLDHWFRQEYSKMLSVFIAKYGVGQIDNIEDAIHDALHKAMMIWGFKEIPNKPSAWIFRVAQNNLIDQFRRKSTDNAIPEIIDTFEEPRISEINDETLRLIFACCHPNLKENESVILCLKFAAGFGLHEISRALLSSYEATKKNFQRAKKKFKAFNLSLDIPENKYLQGRLERVLKVIFLMFTEGYRPTDGDTILKEDLCFEALRMALTIFKFDILKNSKLFALISLMCYKSARLPARIKEGNKFIRLEDQDRKLWVKDLITEGNNFLTMAIKEDNHSEYHFHMAVESKYVNEEKFEDTNWHALMNIYNYWRKITNNPALELNRIVVVMHALGPQRALIDLNTNCSEQKNHLYHAIKGEVLLKLNKPQDAIACFENALKISRNTTEKKLMESKINGLKT